MKKRFKKLFALGLAGIMCIGTVASLSYFTDRESVINNFTTGVLDLESSETSWNTTTTGPDGQIDGHNTYPGYTRLKNPTVQNVAAIEDNDAWVKATVTFIDAKTGKQIVDKERNDLILQTIRYDGGAALVENTANTGGYSEATLTQYPTVNPAFKDVTSTKGTPTTGGKYVYYLKDTLESAQTAAGGEKVELFTTIAYPTEWSQDELDIMGDYIIDVEFSGIQRWTFANVDEAMDALDAEAAGGTLHEEYERVTPGNKDNTPNVN